MSNRMRRHHQPALSTGNRSLRAVAAAAMAIVATAGVSRAEDATPKLQRIVIDPPAQVLTPGDIATFTFYYDAADATLPGVTLRAHYNSNQLALAGVDLLYSPGSLGHQDQADAGSPYLDRYDDGDPATDRRYLAVWSAFDGAWPGENVDQPLALLRLRFEVKDGFAATDLALTGTSCAGCSLELESATLRVVGGGLTQAQPTPTSIPPTSIPPSPTTTPTAGPDQGTTSTGSPPTPYGIAPVQGIPTLSEVGAVLLAAALAASAIALLLRRRG
jgi:hypothetical protein